MRRCLTLPSRGRPQAGFAHLRPPLMSNVRPAVYERHSPFVQRALLIEAAEYTRFGRRRSRSVLHRNGVVREVAIRRGSLAALAEAVKRTAPAIRPSAAGSQRRVLPAKRKRFACTQKCR